MRRRSSAGLLLLPLALGCAPAGRGSSAGAATPVASAPEIHWDRAGVLTRGVPCDSPVVIHESSDGPGVRAEYAFLRRHYPGARTNIQALGQANGRPVDILSITTPDGSPYSVCFDISRFFGHL